jgi:hypothetical protein
VESGEEGGESVAVAKQSRERLWKAMQCLMNGGEEGERTRTERLLQTRHWHLTVNNLGNFSKRGLWAQHDSTNLIPRFRSSIRPSAQRPPFNSSSALRDVTHFALPHHFCAPSYSLSYPAFHKPCPRLQPPTSDLAPLHVRIAECIPSVPMYTHTRYCCSGTP